jgi:hypothetical protein
VSFSYAAPATTTSTPSTSTPSTASTGSVTPAVSLAVLTIGTQTAKATAAGKLALRVVCGGAACSGSLALTVPVTTTVGKGKKKHRKTTTVTLGSTKLTGLAVGTDSVAFSLNGSALTLLAKHGYKLDTTATASYTSGTSTAKASGAVTLDGSAPKKAKKHK